MCFEFRTFAPGNATRTLVRPKTVVDPRPWFLKKKDQRQMLRRQDVKGDVAPPFWATESCLAYLKTTHSASAELDISNCPRAVE